ncbi:D-glycero-alpha-D-manno-heptose-1,7-bisphosphate 7-phosphatase [Inquilinus sp. CA228]|uniref:D-glycero-alpha-D-manno-heptose-1,7-bisphosphate 7-phosphatase n=1 Tax=Inquilinus sp. CA228 TaxID=3455609 RepID=UPI003F8D45C8
MSDIDDPAQSRPMALLDRDGVLNRDTGYPFRPEQIVWIDGALDALARLREAGYRVVVVTNQSGIGRGFYTERDVTSLHEWMADVVRSRGGWISSFYYCPFSPEATIEAYRQDDHPDRKPNPGMLLKALSDFPTNLGRSLMIGDRDSDMAAAVAAGVRGFKFPGGNLDHFVRSALAQFQEG